MMCYNALYAPFLTSVYWSVMKLNTYINSVGLGQMLDIQLIAYAGYPTLTGNPAD